MGKFRRITLGAIALTGAAATPAFANLVNNGSFENNPIGQVGFTFPTLTDWTVTPTAGTPASAFVFSNSTAYTTGVNFVFGSMRLKAGLPTPDTLVDGGTQFYGVDTAYKPSVLSQDISGLVIGDKYKLTFDYAVGQQYSFNGPTSDYWQATIDGQTFNTSTLSITGNPGDTFAGWDAASFTFTYTGVSPTLTLTDINANGANGSVPPFSLIDSVGINNAVPEPSTWAMMVLGFAGLGYAGMRGRRRTAISIA